MPINTGDTAWLLISSALVMLMTPGLALFYGGMVRRKNILSTIMMSFVFLGSIALTVGTLWLQLELLLPTTLGIIGGLDFCWPQRSRAGTVFRLCYTVPHLAFMIFQAMFAIITVALFTGAIVERMKFSALIVFCYIVVYLCLLSRWLTGYGVPAAGWPSWACSTLLVVLWFTSLLVSRLWLWQYCLALAGVFKKEPMEPNNIPLMVLGAGLLWFGWFGFNAGSALTSGGLAASAFVATNISAAAAASTWMLLSWIYRRPTVLGTATGAIVGLAAITPAAGFVTPLAGIPIGMGAAVVCYYAMLLRAKKMGVDESLDVWACHGMGGTWGVLATGIFASVAVNSAGANGLIFGNAMQLAKQLLAVVVVWAFAFGVTWVLGKIVDATLGLRVNATEETVGLDISQHGERAYGGTLR